MKLLFDFLPIILFFAAYQLFDLYVATVVAMVTTVIQVTFSWLKYKKVDNMLLLTLVLVLLLGGLTLLSRDEIFIKWKPTMVNWLFAIVLLGSQLLFRKNLIYMMFHKSFQAPGSIWSILNLSWVVFFGLLGGLNLIVAYNFDTGTWVNFKLFGMMGLTFLFLLIQAFYMARYVNNRDLKSTSED
ncbi:MAG: septation protein A [Gammaproteobacteria bacterium]|nr:septation protein A [Gammaproteobacteria bacterium]MDH5729950.1 septation protein A [Gammaproteobacteria bacterium]